jgi:hypothetical protein
MKNNVIAELKRIAAENDGLLQPETVVDEARPVSSPLHPRFEWNDKVAGDQYRLWQARQLIRVVVEVITATGEKENVFVSLTSDRKESGYRVMTSVLSDSEMRQQMLADALAELECFREKYKRLQELAAVFSAIRKVRKK